MIKKIIMYFYRYKETLIFLACVLLVFSHTITNEIVSWDEATYILAGQSLVDGNLPYSDIWEMKPPLVYFLYAIPIKLFPDSLYSIRFFGFFIIFIVSLQINNIFKFYRLYDLNIVLVLFFISLMSYQFWLYPTTELLALPFLLGSLILLRNFEKKHNILIAGLLMGLAVLVRSNLALLAICLPIFYPIIYKKEYGFKEAFLNSLRFIIGGLIILLGLLAIYFFYNSIDILIASNINVLLVYSSEFSILDSINKYSKTFFKMIYFYPHLFLPFLIAIIYFLFICKNSSIPKKNKSFINLVLFYIMIILVSVIISRQGFSHHFIQLIPFVIILFAFFIHKKNKYFVILSYNFKLTILAVLLLSIFKSVLVFQNTESLDYRIRDFSLEIKPLIDKNDIILALDYHIIYWYLREDIKIPTPIAHTPALVRKSSKDRIKPLEKVGVVEENHIENILNKKPSIIICSTRICIEGRSNLDNNRIKSLLLGYKEIRRIENTTLWEFTKKSSMIVYQRKDE